MDKIADLYTHSPDLCRPVIDPHPGMQCVARFSDDGALYRARVLSVNDDAVQVIFYDYGNTREISALDIFQITSEISDELPPQAVKCVMTCIQPCAGVDATWDEASTARFSELVTFDDSKQFDLIVSNTTYDDKGQLAEVDGKLVDGDIDIADELVCGGYAQKVDDVRIVPAESTNVPPEGLSTNKHNDGNFHIDNGVERFVKFVELDKAEIELEQDEEFFEAEDGNIQEMRKLNSTGGLVFTQDLHFVENYFFKNLLNNLNIIHRR